MTFYRNTITKYIHIFINRYLNYNKTIYKYLTPLYNIFETMNLLFIKIGYIILYMFTEVNLRWINNLTLKNNEVDIRFFFL